MASTLTARLVAQFGTPVQHGPHDALTHLFPSAAMLAIAPLEQIGLPGSRAETLRTIAGAVRDGTIALPLVGRVPVTNRTPHEAEAAVGERLRDGYVIDPKVTMDVIQFRPIYVVGEVTHPGAYDYASNINVINAVAMAGGFTTRAKKDSITVVRGAEPNRTKFTA